jgi:hypothetical protein
VSRAEFVGDVRTWRARRRAVGVRG